MTLGACLLLLGLCAVGGFAECPRGWQQCGNQGKCTYAFSCIADRLCIKHHSLCNIEVNCNNRWDEERCGCGGGKFQCDNKCYNPDQICDGIRHCADGWDEKGCSSCKTGATLCGTTCVPKCNGVQECTDGSDEHFCTSCNFGAFHCNGIFCITPERVCDGIQDCPSNHDEQDCNSCNGDAVMCDGHCAVRCNGRVECKGGVDELNCTRCNMGAFRCTNNTCIVPELLCDGVDDCGDGADELSCNRCNRNAFQCNDKNCIRPELHCDGVADCRDGSDEVECLGCNRDAFHCNDDQCIRPELRCDGVKKCTDGSDEAHCTSCNREAFQCSENHCVLPEHVCDGVTWCKDGIDEVNCTILNANSTVCPAESRCNGVDEDCIWHDEVGCSADMCRYPASEQTYCDHRCLRADQVCNGIQDCTDGFDETNCKECTHGSVFCDGACMDMKQVCDGVRDCADGLDEAHCTSCKFGAFLCDTHHCVRYTHKCDGVPWCLDGTDEHDCNNVSANSSACAVETRCNGLEGACYTKDDEIRCAPSMCQYPANKTTFCDERCMPASKWCDGIRDCFDSKDEKDCLSEATHHIAVTRDKGSSKSSLKADGVLENPQNHVLALNRDALAVSHSTVTQTYIAVVLTALAVGKLVIVVWRFSKRRRLLKSSREMAMLDMDDTTEDL